MQNIEGVIFDLDGTLYNIRHMKLRISFMLLKSLKYLKNLFKARKSVRGAKHRDKEALLDYLYNELATNAGTSADDAKNWYLNTFMPAFVKLLKKKGVARPGISDFLREMRAKNIKLGVVSDFGHVKERLEAIGIDPGLFDTLKASEDFAVLKPSPLPVLGVAGEWDIPVEKIVMVGDRDDMDGECARNAGMFFLGISEKKVDDEKFFMWNEALSLLRVATDLERI